MSNKKLICTIVDNHPRFYWEMLVWNICIERYLDKSDFDSLIYLINPVNQDIVNYLDTNGIAYRLADTWHIESPHCNKIIPYLDDLNSNYDHIIVTDSDWFLVKDIAYYCNDAIRLAPNNSNNPPLHIYRRLFDALGWDNIQAGVSLFETKSGSRESFINNNSGGITVVPKKLVKQYGEHWAKWALWLIDHRPLLGRWKVHVDQIATALAVTEMQLEIHFLPPQTNTVVQLLESTSEIVAFHVAKTHREYYREKFNDDLTFDTSMFTPALAPALNKVNKAISEANMIGESLPSVMPFLDHEQDHETLAIDLKTNELNYQKKPKARSAINRVKEVLNHNPTRQKVIQYIRFSGRFNEAYYLEQNPDVQLAGIDPIVHYVDYGATEGKNPNKGFHTTKYRNTYREVKATQINPFYHYLRFGRTLKYSPYPSRYRRDEEKTTDLEAVEPISREKSNSEITPSVRSIAFYLPQFHEIKENNEWWGKGYTEWTHVKSGLPMYAGQHQPRVPHSDIGYYHLEDHEMLLKQAEMARNAGLEGFSFYYYAFSDKRLLEKPIETLYKHKEIDIGYNIFWANHPWTRTWYGQEREVLKSIDYTAEFYLQFIKDVSKYMKDDRYIRVNGKPLLMMLHHQGPDGPPDPGNTRMMTDIWREYCIAEGIGDLYIMFSQLDFNENYTDKIQGLGYDATFEFIPAAEMWGGIVEKTFDLPVSTNFKGQIYDYNTMISRRNICRDNADHRMYPCLITEWDNTARYGLKSSSFHGCTPEKFHQWAKESVEFLNENFVNKEEKLLFVNGWNEWSEGSYLEPDMKNGYAYLNALSKAISSDTK